METTLEQLNTEQATVLKSLRDAIQGELEYTYLKYRVAPPNLTVEDVVVILKVISKHTPEEIT